MFLIDRHPYLVVSVVMLAFCLGGAWLVASQRRPTILAGLLCAPYAFASPLFVPEYWEPRRIAELIAGPEDLLFSFAAGGLVWLLATQTVRRLPVLELQLATVMRRYLLLSGVFFGIVLGLMAWGSVTAITAVLTSGLVVGGLLLGIRRDLWRLAARGALGYGLAYSLVIGLAFRIWPEFSHCWNWQNLTGYTLFLVPIEEYAYALVFGGAWALGMAYAFGALRPASAEDSGRMEP